MVKIAGTLGLAGIHNLIPIMHQSIEPLTMLTVAKNILTYWD